MANAISIRQTEIIIFQKIKLTYIFFILELGVSFMFLTGNINPSKPYQKHSDCPYND